MDRGQAHTLEAVISAMILLASIGFALQITAVTPLSASPSRRHVENQLRGTAEGILSSAAADGELKDAVLYWSEKNVEFHNATERAFRTTYPPNNSFGNMLNLSFNRNRIAYNVYVQYHGSGGTLQQQRMVYSGEPSDHAVSATHTVAIVDDDYLREYDGRIDWQQQVSDSDSNFYVPDAHSSSGLYNLVKVEVVAWRI